MLYRCDSIMRRSRRNPAQLSDASQASWREKTLNAQLERASETDKANWNGFCEIESEPAFFNVMLHDFGVKGVKIQEVISLDEKLLAFIPRPIYGLIFLFRWSEEDPNKQEQSCPEGVWFANQATHNACASVALLNIINNIPNANLGDELQQFRDFTADLSPALRGYAVINFSFVKQIHNSFARKIDILNGDLHMKSEAASRKRKRVAKGTTDESEAGYHFIAYVPIGDCLWKLDGLERQPEKLANLDGGDWVLKAKPDLEARMVGREGANDFAVMSLVEDPLATLVPRLAENVAALQAITKHLQSIKTSSEDSLSRDKCEDLSKDFVDGPDLGYGLDQGMIDKALVSKSTMKTLQCSDYSVLVTHRFELLAAQGSICSSIKEEQESRRSDQERATRRRHDIEPLSIQLLRALSHQSPKQGSHRKPKVKKKRK